MTRSTARKVIVFIELAAAIASLALGITLALNPTSGVEAYLGVTTSIFVITSLLHRFGDRIFKFEGKDLGPSERLHHREKMRDEIENRLAARRNQGLAYEIIIRHVNRADQYPDIDESGKGISPWFKTELIDTYHRGMRVLLRIESLCICPDGYRIANYQLGENGDEKGYLFGHIPYGSIEIINWDGDEYYNSPIVFCHFDNNGEPYESLVWDKNIGALHGRQVYETIADYESVRLNSIDS